MRSGQFGAFSFSWIRGPRGQVRIGNPSTSVEFDDRVLAHLKVVIVSKLRRGESFMFTWEYPESRGSGHSSVWLNEGISVQFDFLGKREPNLNRLWVDELVQLANTPAGLRVVPEPVAAPVAEQAAKAGTH